MSIVSTAQSYLGTPYVYGGNGYSGIDCSGLTQQSYAQNGISIPRTAQDQYNSSTKITQSQLKPNDLIFESSTGSTSNITHVMLYVGDGKAIESPHSGASVRYTDISTRSNIVGYGTYGASSSSSSSSKTSSSKTSSSSSSKTSSSSSSSSSSNSTGSPQTVINLVADTASFVSTGQSILQKIIMVLCILLMLVLATVFFVKAFNIKIKI